MGVIGLCVFIIAGLGLFLMHLTQSIPNRWPWDHVGRHEDPEGYRRWQIAYGAAAAAGACAFLAGLIF